MSIHYKFKSNLTYDKITFDGVNISVSDLKKAILQQKKIGKSSDFDLQIIDSQTKEVYDSDDKLIPKNTTVIVSRVPVVGVKKHWGKDDSSSKTQTDNGPFHLTLNKILKSSNLCNSDSSEEDKIKTMLSQSSHETYDGTKTHQKRGITGPLPPNYTCFRCGQPGHYIKHCPTNNMDIKRSTGIPRSFLIPASVDQKGALLLSNGEYAVPIIDHEVYKTVKKDRPHFMDDEDASNSESVRVNKDVRNGGNDDNDIPEEIKCYHCRSLLDDAVLTPCCTYSFCFECIRNRLLESDDHQCPSCNEPDVTPDTLVPCRYLRKLVNNYINERDNENITKDNTDESDSDNDDENVKLSTSDSGAAIAADTVVSDEKPIVGDKDAEALTPKQEEKEETNAFVSVEIEAKDPSSEVVDESAAVGEGSIAVKRELIDDEDTVYSVIGNEVDNDTSGGISAAECSTGGGNLTRNSPIEIIIKRDKSEMRPASIEPPILSKDETSMVEVVTNELSSISVGGGDTITVDTIIDKSDPIGEGNTVVDEPCDNREPSVSNEHSVKDLNDEKASLKGDTDDDEDIPNSEIIANDSGKCERDYDNEILKPSDERVLTGANESSESDSEASKTPEYKPTAINKVDSDEHEPVEGESEEQRPASDESDEQLPANDESEEERPASDESPVASEKKIQDEKYEPDDKCDQEEVEKNKKEENNGGDRRENAENDQRDEMNKQVENRALTVRPIPTTGIPQVITAGILPVPNLFNRSILGPQPAPRPLFPDPPIPPSNGSRFIDPIPRDQMGNIISPYMPPMYIPPSTVPSVPPPAPPVTSMRPFGDPYSFIHQRPPPGPPPFQPVFNRMPPSAIPSYKPYHDNLVSGAVTKC